MGVVSPSLCMSHYLFIALPDIHKCANATECVLLSVGRYSAFGCVSTLVSLSLSLSVVLNEPLSPTLSFPQGGGEEELSLSGWLIGLLDLFFLLLFAL